MNQVLKGEQMNRKERFPKNYHGAWYRQYESEYIELVSMFYVADAGPFRAVQFVFEDRKSCCFEHRLGWGQKQHLEPVNKASRQLLEALS